MTITVGYHQTNRKTDTGKTLKRWPVLVDHYKEGDLPAISEANILSTFEQLHHNKQDVFERGIINVFRGLSWGYKTNNPC